MGAKSKKSSKEKDSKKSISKKSSKKLSKEKDKSSKSKDKSSKKSKSPNSKNDSLIIKAEDLNDKKPELDPMLNQNQIPITNINNDYNNKYFATLETNTNNPFIQIQNSPIFPAQIPNIPPLTINSPNTLSVQKCEGCFIADAVCFCKECGKAYCPSCDSQIHLVPIYKSHERVPINEMKHLKHLCVHHNLPLKLFCDSCNEPACDECKISGPHDTKLHSVKNIIEAYNEKYKVLMNITENKIIGEINYLINNQNLIENKIKELENKGNNIEKEINEAYYNNIEKLNSEKGKRIAILNYESSKYQKEMINIQEIINYNEEYSKNNKNFMRLSSKNEEEKQIEYLLKYKSILENIEAIISKPLNDISLEKGIESMPLKEITENLKMENYSKMKAILKVKNDIIWNLILMRKKLPEKALKKYKEKKFEINNEKINTINGIDNEPFTSIYSNKKEKEERDINNFLEEIKFFIKRNNFNMFQLLSENCIKDNKEFISKNNLLNCLQKINLDIDDDKLGKILMKYDLFKEFDSININDFLKLLIFN